MRRGGCNLGIGPVSRGSFNTHLGGVLLTTATRANGRIIILVSRCSTPVRSSMDSRSLRGAVHGVVQSFFDPLGRRRKGVHFMFVANVSGFDRLDVFDRLGGLGVLALGSRCDDYYNVAGDRLARCFHRKVRRVTRRGKLACRRALKRLGRRCSNCRFDVGDRSVFGPCDVVGTLSSGRFGDC